MEDSFKEKQSTHLKADQNAFSRVISSKEADQIRSAKVREVPYLERGILALELETGEIFYKITAYPKTQQFISRLLKSGFPVADIVEIEESHYSYSPQSLKNAQENQTAAQVQADIEMISFLTNDFDREYSGEDSHGNTIIHNLRINREKSEEMLYSAYYDFDRAFHFFARKHSTKYENYIQKESKEIREYVLAKSQALLEYWKSEAGRAQVEAAFAATGKSMDELFLTYEPSQKTTFNDFYSLLLERTEKLHAITKKVGAGAQLDLPL